MTNSGFRGLMKRLMVVWRDIEEGSEGLEEVRRWK